MTPSAIRDKSSTQFKTTGGKHQRFQKEGKTYSTNAREKRLGHLAQKKQAIDQIELKYQSRETSLNRKKSTQEKSFGKVKGAHSKSRVNPKLFQAKSNNVSPVPKGPKSKHRPNPQ